RIAAGLPYRAHNAALSAIGSQRDQADFEFLMKATEDKRFNGIIEGGAYRALAETRSPAAFEILLNASRPAATGHRARKSANSSLGKLAAYLPKEKQVVAREALEDIVRE